MKELQTEFDGTGEMKGFHFKQIEKSDYAYVYEVSFDEDYHWEVFERKENTRFGCISYPKSSCFGIWAWCYTNKSKCIARFNEINDTYKGI